MEGNKKYTLYQEQMRALANLAYRQYIADVEKVREFLESVGAPDDVIEAFEKMKGGFCFSY